MLCIIFFIISICLATIKYDSNYFYEWNYDVVPDFTCKGGLKFDKTIVFIDSFANIPQIFITYEIEQIQIGYKITILQALILVLQILQQQTFKSIYIVNMRETIDSESDGLLLMIKEYKLLNLSYYYANVNCNKYFTSITSFSATGSIDVYFTPPNIVTVYIPYVQGKSENLKSIGFQLILGIDEAFAQPQIIYSNSQYDSLVYEPNQSDRVEFYPFSGIVYENTHLYQLVVYTISNGVGTKYVMHDWGAGYNPNYHQKIRMLKLFTTVNSPILCNFLRYSQKLEYKDLPRPMFSVEFTTDSDVYISNGYRTISKSISNFDLIIKCNCITGKKIKSMFLKCENCPPNKNSYKLEHSCYGAINLLFINARFVVQTNAIQELSIEITTQSCKISQYIYNEQSNTIIIADIQMIDS